MSRTQTRAARAIPRFVAGGGGSDFDTLVLSHSPLAYYKLDEASGASSFVDSSGNSRGALGQQGSVTAGSGSLLSTGVGNSVTFPGSGHNYLSAAYDNSWMNVTSFTLMALVRPTAVNVNSFIFGRDDLSGSNTFRAMSMTMSSAGAFACQFQPSTGSPVTYTLQSSAFSANTIYHVVCTFDGTTVKGYLNGSLCAGTGTPGVGVKGNSSVALTVGHSAITLNGSGFWDYPGRIGRCAYFNTALSATDIADIAAAR